MSTTQTIGSSASPASLFIKPRSAFSATVQRTNGPNWTLPPTIEFYATKADRDDPDVDPLATWTASIAGTVATFSEDRETAYLRANGECVVLRDNDNDEAIALATVVRQQ